MPTIKTVKEIDGKRKTVEESRLPNIFFARGTEEEIKSYVYDNVNLPYLRFYYSHHREGTRIVKEPLIVPDYQIESLKIICASEAEDIILVPSDVHKFKTGQTVRVIDGVFYRSYWESRTLSRTAKGCHHHRGTTDHSVRLRSKCVFRRNNMKTIIMLSKLKNQPCAS